MQKEIILKSSQILCALGNLEQSGDLLYKGRSGFSAGPCFGVPVPYAPFSDISLRKFENTIEKLNFNVPQNTRSLLFIYCAAKGDLSHLEAHYLKDKSIPITSSLLNSQTHRIISLLGIKPSKSTVISSACASGAAAIDYAKEQLILGTYSDVLIFGFDVISEFVVKGFHSLAALSADGARPFDKSRDGLTLGDGAAIAWLTLDTPQTGDILICGSGTSNDANHRTGPSRTGDGLLRAMQAALLDANLEPGDIGAVKCHGTATNYNDAMEAKALFSCFNCNIPPCVSLKGAIGHTSGAGSLLEIALSAVFLKKGYLPPTARFEEHGVDEPVKISNESQKIDKKSIMCLSAGFGGLNAAVIIKEQL
jgi:3-oxoacyl-[acyl-carrier-protein] synthase-1